VGGSWAFDAHPGRRQMYQDQPAQQGAGMMLFELCPNCAHRVGTWVQCCETDSLQNQLLNNGENPRKQGYLP
jgi:hypothetical protein